MGKVLMSGIVPKLSEPVVPPTEISGGDLAVGNSVFIRVNGVLTEFLVVNQGIPSNSSLYDASCDGTWIMSKDIYTDGTWGGSYKYEQSDVHSYLNNTFLALLDSNVQNAISSVKIPYTTKTDYASATPVISSGADGLSTKVFIPGAREVGLTSSNFYETYKDGACLDYFNGKGNAGRIAYKNNVAWEWWLRTPERQATRKHLNVDTDGSCGGYTAGYGETNALGYRPTMVLPSNALFDVETMEFVGVA